jgi:glycine/D-amino acid oxidase-like deaminating enzyme
MRASTRTDLIVVGAGIVGASVAFHAARGGAAVVLVDRSRPAAGVTGDSFAWIGGGPAQQSNGSTALRGAVLDDWARLERDVPRITVCRTGSLSWGRQAFRTSSTPGSDERFVSAEEIARLEPNLRTPPPRALLRPTDAAIDPVAVTEALVDEARRHGAEARLTETVRGLRVQDHAVVGVDTSMSTIVAGAVVLAAGIGSATLCTPLGISLPIAASPAVLIRFNAPPGVVRTVVSSPEVEVRQTPEGLLLAAEGYAGETSEDDLRHTAHSTLQRLEDTFTFPRDVQLVDVRIGKRPMPADGLPIIGPLPGRRGAYIAVMHSAVTLAPSAGRLVAAEVLDGRTFSELQHLRPDRFATRA